MLRKLASLFFEEEEEIVEDEEIEAKGPQLPPIAKVVEKKTPRVELASEVKPFELPPLVEAVKATPRSVVEPPVKAAARNVVEPPVKPATRIDIGPETMLQKQKRTVSENKSVYEFTPVISPIFGISEKDKQSVVIQNSTPPQPAKHSPLQTIISPIYGVMRNNQIANEEFTQPVVLNAIPTLDIKNFTLDEILHEETLAKEKILEQFSLFEENTDV
jgi:hypothetical protein